MARKTKQEIIIENISDKIIDDTTILQEKCIVKTINIDTVGVYFKGFGISVIAKKQYNIGDEITINYKSDIGKSDFEYWIES